MTISLPKIFLASCLLSSRISPTPWLAMKMRECMWVCTKVQVPSSHACVTCTAGECLQELPAVDKGAGDKKSSDEILFHYKKKWYRLSPCLSQQITELEKLKDLKRNRDFSSGTSPQMYLPKYRQLKVSLKQFNELHFLYCAYFWNECPFYC